ncbi:MAG: hypothetical protein A2020_04680 [Lentisphaerae bacterium GWF2_45_14]|nr:MAG: hypothetical protein A2020_04680 [Lentisphaerae bacterium GWF2_45_14]
MHVNLEENTIGGEDAEFRFSSERAPAMNFYLNGAERLRLMPLSFGEFDESSGFISDLKLHEAQDESSWSADTKSIIPFGPEPSISRSIEIFSNCAMVTTDIKTTKGISCSDFSVDNLFLPGAWKKAGIISIPESDCRIKDILWVDLDTTKKTIYESDKPFLTAVFESETGEQIETGTGDDIWRWSSGARLGGSSSFTIEHSPEGIHIKRNVLHLEEASEFPARNWRFKWYFAWNSGKTVTPLETDKNAAAAFDACKSRWPDPAKVVFNGNIRKEVCFCAHISQKRFKKTIRSTSGESNVVMNFINMEPHICEDNSHTGKTNMEKTLHWDMMKILDLRLWAERQLRKTGSRLTLEVAEGSIFRYLPSVNKANENNTDISARMAGS